MHSTPLMTHRMALLCLRCVRHEQGIAVASAAVPGANHHHHLRRVGRAYTRGLVIESARCVNRRMPGADQPLWRVGPTRSGSTSIAWLDVYVNSLAWHSLKLTF